MPKHGDILKNGSIYYLIYKDNSTGKLHNLTIFDDKRVQVGSATDEQVEQFTCKVIAEDFFSIFKEDK